jgi:hypothetical protein
MTEVLCGCFRHEFSGRSRKHTRLNNRRPARTRLCRDKKTTATDSQVQLVGRFVFATQTRYKFLRG